MGDKEVREMRRGWMWEKMDEEGSGICGEGRGGA